MKDVYEMTDRNLKKVNGYAYNVETVFKEYYSPLCYFASQYIQDDSITEDIVQDVFISLLEKKVTFQTELHLKNFLYLSVRNACLNALRNKVSREKYIEFITREESSENFEDNLILTEVHKELAEAVEKLPPECRKVFDLSYFQGKDNETVAEELGLSVNTVKAQKARGKKILREGLKDIFPFVMFFLNILDKYSWCDY